MSKGFTVKKRTIAVLLIGQVLLLVLLLTSVVVRSKALMLEEHVGSQAAPVPVVVAAADLPAQTRLTAKQVQVVKVPHHGLPPNYLSSSSHVVGVRLKVDISQGECLTTDMVTREMTAVDLVHPGMRAFALSFSPDAGVGLVRPGSIVDLHVTFSIDDKKIGESLVIAPLLQQLYVLAVDGETVFTQGNPEAAAPRASSGNIEVVLEVTEKQAVVLHLALRGKLALVLRNPAEHTLYPVQPMVLKQGRIEAFGAPLDPQDPTAYLDLMRVPPARPAPEPVQDAADPRGEKK